MHNAKCKMHNEKEQWTICSGLGSGVNGLV